MKQETYPPTEQIEYTTIRIRTDTRQAFIRIAAALTLRNGEIADASKAAEFAAALAEAELTKREAQKAKAR